jgi:hypothetical protein
VIKRALEKGDKRFYDALGSLPIDLSGGSDPRGAACKDAYASFVEAQPVQSVTDDDVPF